jgi:hypothetical protein
LVSRRRARRHSGPYGRLRDDRREPLRQWDGECHATHQRCHRRLPGEPAALKDPSLFAQARCDEGFVAWPGDLDLAPDAMHEEIKARGVWVLE